MLAAINPIYFRSSWWHSLSPRGQIRRRQRTHLRCSWGHQGLERWLQLEMIWKFTWVGLKIWSFYTYFVDIITYLIVTIRPIKMEVLGSIHPHGSIQENTGNIDLENDSWKIAALDVPCRVLSVICGLLCKELANIKGQWIQPCPSPKKGRGQPWLILDAVQKVLVSQGSIWHHVGTTRLTRTRNGAHHPTAHIWG